MSIELKKVKVTDPNPLENPRTMPPNNTKIIHTTKLPDNFDIKLSNLMEQEKTFRNSEDLEGNIKVILEIVKLCADFKNWKKLGECAHILANKQFAKKEAILAMIRACMEYLKFIEKESRVLFIQDLRDISKGKIYLEVERSRLTKDLADLKESEGFIKEASDIMGELQIESIGTMPPVERVEFFLHQIRLYIATGQFEIAKVMANKIPKKLMDDEGNEFLKLVYYKLKVKLERETSYQNTCRYYTKMSEISILSEEEKQHMIVNAVIYSILSPYDNEKSTLMESLLKNPIIIKNKDIKEMLEYFLSKELININEFCENHSSNLKNLQILNDSTSYGHKIRKDLRRRYVEHVR